MNNYDYPMGSDTSDAPWNQEDLPEREIEVTVSVTLSKTMKVMVDDYREEEDEDGRPLGCDFSNCDLCKAVEEQIVLPQNLAKFTENMFKYDLDLKAAGMSRYLKEAIEDCKGWNVDDFEVVQE